MQAGLGPNLEEVAFLMGRYGLVQLGQHGTPDEPAQVPAFRSGNIILTVIARLFGETRRAGPDPVDDAVGQFFGESPAVQGGVDKNMFNVVKGIGRFHQDLDQDILFLEWAVDLAHFAVIGQAVQPAQERTGADDGHCIDEIFLLQHILHKTDGIVGGIQDVLDLGEGLAVCCGGKNDQEKYQW